MKLFFYVILAISGPCLALAQDEASYCQTHPGESFNLKNSGQVLENSPVLDQDGSGICAAASSTLGFNAFLRRNTPNDGIDEEVSTWSLALEGAEQIAQGLYGEDRKRGLHPYLSYQEVSDLIMADAQATAVGFAQLADFPDAIPTVIANPEDPSKVKLYLPTSRPVDLLYGLYPCGIVEQVASKKSWCPAASSPIEQSLRKKNSTEQASLLLALGHLFDSIYLTDTDKKPEDILGDLALVNDALWDQAYQFCQIPVDERLESMRPQIQNDQSLVGELFSSFSRLYGHAFQQFIMLREPYEEYFNKKKELERTKQKITNGVYKDVSWEQEIEATKQNMEAAKDPEIKAIYSTRHDSAVETYARLQTSEKELEAWLKANESKNLPLSTEYLEARKAMASFAPYLQEDVSDEESWNDRTTTPAFNTDAFFNEFKKTTLSATPTSETTAPMGLDGSLKKLFTWDEFERSFEKNSAWAIPESCSDIQFLIELKDVSLQNSLMWKSCVPAQLSGTYQDLVRTLGLLDQEHPALELQRFVQALKQARGPDGISPIEVAPFYGQMLAPECLSQSIPLPEKPLCYERPVAESKNSVEKINREMVDLIQLDIPMVISSCAIFLSRPGPTISNGSCMVGNQHAMAVTGYKCSEQGEIKFLVQNSWGETWCPENQELECVAGQGAFYVDAQTLQSHTLKFTAIVDKEEEKQLKRRYKYPLFNKKPQLDYRLPKNRANDE